MHACMYLRRNLMWKNSKNENNVATNRCKNHVIAFAGKKIIAWLNLLAVGTQQIQTKVQKPVATFLVKLRFAL